MLTKRINAVEALSTKLRVKVNQVTVKNDFRAVWGDRIHFLSIARIKSLETEHNVDLSLNLKMTPSS